MAILARILRFLFWVLVLSWSISLLKRLFHSVSEEGKSASQAESAPEVLNTKTLLRDPVCGMHVAEELAITARTGNEIVCFCSAECRDKYMKEHQKLVANG